MKLSLLLIPQKIYERDGCILTPVSRRSKGSKHLHEISHDDAVVPHHVDVHSRNLLVLDDGRVG